MPPSNRRARPLRARPQRARLQRARLQRARLQIDRRGPERTRWIRRLGSSTFNYWFGYVANVSLVLWLANHALAPGPGRLRAAVFVLLGAVGLLSWTLSEYLLHRYIYHLWPSFLSEGHALHHRSPRALIGVPWYLTTVAVVALFEVLAPLFRPAPVGVVMAGNWLGYILYCVAHHGSHHWSYRRAGSSGWLGRWVLEMQRHHLLHHAHPTTNWGFTTPLWDRIFGTHHSHPPDGHCDNDGQSDRPAGHAARRFSRPKAPSRAGNLESL